MTTPKHTRTILVTSLAIIALASTAVATAAAPKIVIIEPPLNYGWKLPKFGFVAKTDVGVGLRVLQVHWNSRAYRMGLEEGDMILSLNGRWLDYPGAWDQALRRAMYNGGWVELRVRDVRTGSIVYREAYLGPADGDFPSYKYQVAQEDSFIDSLQKLEATAP